MSRLSKEQEIIEKMITIYCQAKHRSEVGSEEKLEENLPKNSSDNPTNSSRNQSKDKLCTECRALAEYASQRLKDCPFGEEKSVCENCEVHCYKPDMRDQIRAIMRFAGPKMIYKHPVAAISHLIQKRKKPE